MPVTKSIWQIGFFFLPLSSFSSCFSFSFFFHPRLSFPHFLLHDPSITIIWVIHCLLPDLNYFCLAPPPPSSCVRWWPSCCITSSCQHLPGCSWRACISTACRPSSATSTSVPWGFTMPSAGACLPLSRVTHTCRHVMSLWCLSQTCLSIQVYTQSNVLLHANALS